ncbi:MAG TPA: hypothetical protein VFH73_20905 [Polyangia bacterium]|jgi:hypothetical protein|nr:hypothetical protein [Polyangia bacterium]
MVLGLIGVAAIAALALIETAVAIIEPLRAPTTADWQAAAELVRGQFHKGDLIVAAPAWADPVMRLHLGDLIPIAVAGRLDDGRFGRVWEIGQRSEHAPEAETGTVALAQRFGALTVRRIERPPAVVTYDFVARWSDATLSRVDNKGTVTPCPLAGDRLACPDIGFNFVKAQLVEVDTRLRQALLAQPVGNATVVVEYPNVPLGREIVLGTGLHNVWMRKAARGPVDIKVVVDGQAMLTVTTTNDTGWTIWRINTVASQGKTATVRFEITSPAPYQRHFAFAAEARS